MVFTGIESTICSDASDGLVRRDLVKQIRQHRGITGMTPSDLDGLNLQSLLIDPKISLVPDPPPGPVILPMLACVPLALTPDLDAVLSIIRCSGPLGLRYGLSKAIVLWLRNSVPNSGIAQLEPMRCNRLLTKPLRQDHSEQCRFDGSICRNAMPNRSFIVRQVWMTVSP